MDVPEVGLGSSLGFQCGKYRLGVACDFDAAPCVRKVAMGIDQEGAAHDAHDLAAIHVLLVDDIEGAAYGLVGIGNQAEGQGLLGDEVLVGFHRVARYAEDGGAGSGVAQAPSRTLISRAQRRIFRFMFTLISCR